MVFSYPSQNLCCKCHFKMSEIPKEEEIDLFRSLENDISPPPPPHTAITSIWVVPHPVLVHCLGFGLTLLSHFHCFTLIWTQGAQSWWCWHEEHGSVLVQDVLLWSWGKVLTDSHKQSINTQMVSIKPSYLVHTVSFTSLLNYLPSNCADVYTQTQIYVD